jgi:hypothetical protein
LINQRHETVARGHVAVPSGDQELGDVAGPGWLGHAEVARGVERRIVEALAGVNFKVREVRRKATTEIRGRSSGSLRPGS